MFRSKIAVLLCLAGLVSACSNDADTLKRKAIASGDKFLKARKYDDAILEYRRAVQIVPNDGQAHLKLAEAYSAIDDAFNALPEYVRAADRLPLDLPLQLKAGNLLLLGGRW